MLEGFGIATGISRLVGGQQVFAVGGEVDGTNACAIEDIAQSVTLLWIGCRRDNGFAVRLKGDFRNAVRFVRGCKIFDYDFVAAGFECELELAVGGGLFLVVDIYFVMLRSADLTELFLLCPAVVAASSVRLLSRTLLKGMAVFNNSASVNFLLFTSRLSTMNGPFIS